MVFLGWRRLISSFFPSALQWAITDFVVGIVSVVVVVVVGVFLVAVPFLVTVAHVFASAAGCWSEGPAWAVLPLGDGGGFVAVACFGLLVLLLLLLLLPLTGGLSLVNVP